MKNIIFDKSTLQALSFEDINLLKHFVKIVITAPLMREIQANLNDSSGKNKVTQLSNKLTQSKVIYQYAFESIIESELLGNQIPRDGTPLLFSNSVVYKGGKLIVLEPEPSIQINRWSNNSYTSDDFKVAQAINSYHKGVDLNKNKEHWAGIMNPPKFASLLDCKEWLDNAIQNMNQASLLQFILDEVVKSNDSHKILQRWHDEKFESLLDFSWAGHWYLTQFFFLCFGITSDLVPSSKKAKAYLDLEYISYLPYSHGISSGDKLFEKFYNIYSRDDQIYLSVTDIKDRLQSITAGKRSDFF